MPFVRCRYYNDSGEPVKGGCRKGAGCTFVHPKNPDWNSAPLPSSKPRDKGGDSTSFKWGVKRGTTVSSGWDAGGSDPTSTSDAGGGWGDVKGWGDDPGWGGGGRWGGWGGGDSTSTSNQAPEPAQSNTLPNFSSATSAPPPAERKQAETASTRDGNTKSKEHGWGGGETATESGWGASSWGIDAHKETGSGWGNTSASGWGDNNGPDKETGSGWGNTRASGWGVSNETAGSWRGDNTDANRDAGSARNGGSGSGSRGNRDPSNSWGAPSPMIVDKQETERTRNKGKSKAVPAPPRIRIPDHDKKTKITGTNNEPLGNGKQWGEPQSSNLVTPAAASTPVTALTPTDASRLKRKRDAAFDQFDVFKDYVKTWERGVRARFLLAEAEAKRDRWFRTQKSLCYARIGEAGRKRLDGERTECDDEVTLQRDKLSSAVKSLAQFHDAITSNIDLGQRYNISQQAEEFIIESKAFVDEVRELLVKHVLKDKNDAQQSGDTEKPPSGVIGEPTSIDSLRSQIRELEERFDQAQTELTLRHQRDVHSEVEELLATKIAALRVARQHEIDRIASQSRTEIVIPPSALEKIEAMASRVRELDAKMPQTVDIRALLLRVDATTKRVDELEKELSTNKTTYNEQVQQMAAEREESERRTNERLKKIREQFEQLVAPQPSGPVEQTVTYSLRDKLMESLRPEFEAVVNKFYEREVRPTIEALQRDVIKASDRHQEEAIQVLWGKLQPAMNMVAGVSRWLDSQELRLTAPNA